MSPEFVMRPIGIIRSPFTEPKGMPIQPTFSQAIGRVEVLPEYADGLQDLEGFSHIILIYALHRAEGYALRVKPFLDDVDARSVRHALPTPAQSHRPLDRAAAVMPRCYAGGRRDRCVGRHTAA